MEENMAENDGFIKGFFIGGLIGAFVGLLAAPKTGKEFREELGEESEKFFNRTKKDFDNAKKAAAQSFDVGRDKFMEKIVNTDIAEGSQEDIQEKLENFDEPKKETVKKPKSRKKTSAKKSE